MQRHCRVTYWRAAVASLALAAALMACGRGGGEANGNGTDGGPAGTVAALSTSLAAQSTAVVADAEATRVASVATNEARLNEEALAAAATRAVQEAAQLQLQSATATAVAPILSELAAYGVDPSQGQVAWIHPPARLDVTGFEQFDYINEFLATVARDFVVSADITWNTRFGESGCGLVLRTDGNQDALSQYLVIATRAANGHVFFARMDAGELELVKDMYARGIDPAFTSANDTTNRLTVVARGPLFTIYTNGTQVGQFEDDTYDRGFVALTALNRSGRTQCQFDNTWLWLFDQ
jgi:hypothetical protein